MGTKKIKHLLTLKDWTTNEILDTVRLAEKIKKSPVKYKKKLEGKTLLMMFAKPSLRTHLSFDVAMHKLGGHAIFYDLKNSTLGKKESIKDFSKVVSRYVDIVMARLYAHKDIVDLANNSDVPVINGLTDAYHPCQIVGDLLTMKENLKDFKNVNIAFLGDCNNNVTHSLIVAANKLNIGIVVCCPKKKDFLPNKDMVGGMMFTVDSNPKSAVYRASVIYTDSWMSYQVPKSQEKKRMKALKPFQVNVEVMNYSKKNPIFMHCLPARRGNEVTDEVMDSKQSAVYQQAENRMWSEMAILLKVLKKN
jgi:ornithine carbamoyltransferase